MSIIERDVVLVGRDANGNKTLDMPLTCLKNIEDTAEVKAAPESGDYIPVVDSSDKGQMKKTPVEALMAQMNSALPGFGTISATVGTGTGTPTVNVTASGPDSAKNINFSFENLKGEKGDTGLQGVKGDTGVGVPAGGNAGQVLVKSSGTDYDTKWIDAPQGGSVSIDDLLIVPVSKGGTGATTSAAALNSIGAAAVSHNHSVSDITSGTLPITRGEGYVSHVLDEAVGQDLRQCVFVKMAQSTLAERELLEQRAAIDALVVAALEG